MFNHFDVDMDGFLSCDELATFAVRCGSEPLSADEYVGLSEALADRVGHELTDPKRGLTIEEFRETYGLSGGDGDTVVESILEDYRRVFCEGT
jgi:hypothetical protein